MLRREKVKEKSLKNSKMTKEWKKRVALSPKPKKEKQLPVVVQAINYGTTKYTTLSLLVAVTYAKDS
jgi:hypothetical protein